MDKILIRADGNANIGAGHIMRCMSIAVAAREQGIETLFVVADNSFYGLLKNSGFAVEVLNTDYSKMEAEFEILKHYIESFKPTVTLIDSYYVTEAYLSNIKKYSKLAYIDDVKAFAYPVDILINYNIYAEDLCYEDLYNKSNINVPELMLGGAFIPLRKEFQGMEEVISKRNVTDILFSAGGADPERIALNFVKVVIDNEKLQDYNFHVILGKFEPDVNEINDIAKENKNIIVHENVSHMAEVMKKCDIAISAAGSTLYELCACGIPTITYILADNQVLGAVTMEKKEIMLNVGDYRYSSDFFEILVDKIVSLCGTYEMRHKMHNLARKAVDGKGTVRIVQQLTTFNKNESTLE